MIFIAENWEEIKFLARSLNKDEIKQILSEKPKTKVITSTGRIHLYHFIKGNIIGIPGETYDSAYYGWLHFIEACQHFISQKS